MRIIGELPRDARLELQKAATVGKPGSIHRRVAIERAERYVATHYPEYLKQENDSE
ncbi:MAG: hypothetical protein V4659_00910 [Pseudomonadota bacterium]